MCENNKTTMRPFVIITLLLGIFNNIGVDGACPYNMHRKLAGKGGFPSVRSKHHNVPLTADMVSQLQLSSLYETSYDPTKVDWKSLISGCKASFRYEKRLANFYIRAAFHDSVSQADGSFALTLDELTRNNYDNFAFLVARNAQELSKTFKASVADVIAVCGAVATEFLKGPNLFITGKSQSPFYVGRMDSTTPNPMLLPDARDTVEELLDFAHESGLSLEDIIGLLGSHVFLDTGGCLQVNGTYCDPYSEPCVDNLKMFTWDNVYYRDICSITTQVSIPSVSVPIDPVNNKFVLAQELCKFTSKTQRQKVFDLIVTEADAIIEEGEFVDVRIVGSTNPWAYTTNDAFIGQVCQDSAPSVVKEAMTRFRDSIQEWNVAYSIAYKKMIRLRARWSPKLEINGRECPSGYIIKSQNTRGKGDNRLCVNCVLDTPTQCDPSCRCKTELDEDALLAFGI
jgi:hypothetical protein